MSSWDIQVLSRNERGKLGSRPPLGAELDSMFRYYSLSDVCYAYLADVHPKYEGMDSLFRRSRWHTRGWTLQELIAPKIVVFIVSNWAMLGDKNNLAYELEEITGVPARVLCFEEDVSKVSIAARMSWVAKRQTTRPEDQAYCLFGLFGVSLPTFYGEGGSSAFYRLQEEIVKSSPDSSIFAWGISDYDAALWDLPYHHDRLLESAVQFSNNHAPSLDLPSLLPTYDCSDPQYHLFAPHPSKFGSCERVCSISERAGITNQEVSAIRLSTHYIS